MSVEGASPTNGHVPVGSARGRWIIAATVLGSGVAFLDGTIVNVALPHIRTGLAADFATLQWVVNAYLLALGALVLVGGTLADLAGRRLVFVIGLVGFGAASVACGLAPTAGLLVAARAAQGVAAALLVPTSLALLTATFSPEERGRAIGTWSGLSGASTALGPFVGGYLVDAASWRWAFLVNVPIIAVAVVVTLRHVPESVDPACRADPLLHRLDVPGAVTCAVGLALPVYVLIEANRLGTGRIVALTLGGVAALTAFLVIERRRTRPMLPLSLFRSRVFTSANVVTFAVYGALSGSMFLLSLELQDQLGYSALEAGAATVPFTLLLLVLSGRIGAALPRTGLRLPLVLGPALGAVGLLLLARVEPGASYLTDVFPGVTVFALGMCLVVTPVTTAAMAAADDEHSGIASGVNNAVARVAGLVAVAVLPLAAGIDAGDSSGSGAFTDGYQRATLIAAGLFAAAAVAALLGLPGRGADTVRSEPDRTLADA